MFDSVRPHRGQPTRVPRPWDSPGKNTGVDCHFPLQCMKVKSEREVAQSCPTLSDPMDCSLPGASIHGIFQARVLEWGAMLGAVKSKHNRNVQACFLFSLSSLFSGKGKKNKLIPLFPCSLFNLPAVWGIFLVVAYGIY